MFYVGKRKGVKLMVGKISVISHNKGVCYYYSHAQAIMCGHLGYKQAQHLEGDHTARLL